MIFINTNRYFKLPKPKSKC